MKGSEILPLQVIAAYHERAEKNTQWADRCWGWANKPNAKGYSVMSVTVNGKPKPYRAHRVAYMIYVGEIPGGLILDHLCRNRACVNPWHLEPVTNSENVLRGEGPTAKHARKTHCPQGHPLSGENLRVKRDRRGPQRTCRVCYRDQKREYKSRRRAAGLST